MRDLVFGAPLGKSLHHLQKEYTRNLGRRDSLVGSTFSFKPDDPASTSCLCAAYIELQENNSMPASDSDRDVEQRRPIRRGPTLRANPGKTLGKPWANPGQTLGNPGQTLGKPWANPGTSWRQATGLLKQDDLIPSIALWKREDNSHWDGCWHTVYDLIDEIAYAFDEEHDDEKVGEPDKDDEEKRLVWVIVKIVGDQVAWLS